MPNYYTVDRLGQLSVGAELNCDADFSSCRFFPVQDHFLREELEALANELFPNGLARQGKRHFLDESIAIKTPQGFTLLQTPIIELVLELVRRLSFPKRPSRLTSLFAWGSLGEARRFRDERGGTLFQLAANESFRADMNLLYLGSSGVGTIQFANKYWRGDAGPNPRWEYLLELPVKVLDRVDLG